MTCSRAERYVSISWARCAGVLFTLQKPKYWSPDADAGYVSGEICEDAGDEVTLLTEDGKVRFGTA